MAPGLFIEGVKGKAAEMSRAERRDEGIALHDFRARDIDQTGARLHQRQSLAIDEVLGGSISRKLRNDPVALRQQRVQRPIGCPSIASSPGGSRVRWKYRTFIANALARSAISRPISPSPMMPTVLPCRLRVPAMRPKLPPGTWLRSNGRYGKSAADSCSMLISPLRR